MRYAFPMLLLFLSTYLSDRTYAGIISSHGFAATYGLGVRDENFANYNFGDQAYQNDTGSFSNVIGQFWSVGAAASIGSYGEVLMHASSSTYVKGAMGFDPSSIAEGQTAWRDIVFVNGSAPDAIRLNFVGNGYFESSVDSCSISGVNGNLNLQTINAVLSDQELIDRIGQYSSNVNLGVHSFLHNNLDYSEKWHFKTTLDLSNDLGSIQQDSETIARFNYTLSYSVVLPFSSEIGGYAFTTLFDVASESYGTASGASNFGHTLGLVSVTQLDGSDLGAFRFDSGLQLNSVPEPASILIFGLCTCGMLAAEWHRKRATS